MKIKGHKRKNTWSPPTFTILDINRDELALILLYARNGIEKELAREKLSEVSRDVINSMSEKVEKLEKYINADEENHHNQEEI